MNDILKQIINQHKDFPRQGILFQDILPLLQYPDEFSKVIGKMASSEIIKKADAIIAIDARGFIFGSTISMNLCKPMVVARKPGKLPGELLEKSYELEYGTNSLSIQKDAIKEFKSFAIIDDLLATGGTVDCVSKMLIEDGKKIMGLSVVIELKDLNGRKKLPFPVDSQIIL